MNRNRKWLFASLLLCACLSQRAVADCAIAEDAKKLDPVEVGFCESDAVFVGKVEVAIETVRAFTAEGSNRTQHFRVQRAPIQVIDRLKESTPEKLPEKVTMVADLYAKGGAYTFESGKTYLVFAKRLPVEGEYAGTSAACSVQPSLHIEEAAKVLKQLEQHRKGVKKIDCQNIRSKE